MSIAHPNTNQSLSMFSQKCCNPGRQAETGIRRRSWILIGALSSLLVLGCQGQKKQNSRISDSVASDSSALTKEQATPPVGSIARNASPTEVAKTALLAIKLQDKKTLQSLVAINKVQQDVAAITRGRATFQDTVDKAVPFAVNAITSEINWLDVDGRETDQETIVGDSAWVTVKGMRAGKELTKRFFLIKEDDQWRLVPSHR